MSSHFQRYHSYKNFHNKYIFYHNKLDNNYGHNLVLHHYCSIGVRNDYTTLAVMDVMYCMLLEDDTNPSFFPKWLVYTLLIFSFFHPYILEYYYFDYRIYYKNVLARKDLFYWIEN